jgi:hypothetical protein
MWCVDRWYVSWEWAEEVRLYYLSEGATEAHIVTHTKNGTFAVLYEASTPFSELPQRRGGS